MPYDDQTGTIVRKICMACSREFNGQTAHCPHDGNMLVSLPQDQWEGRRLADRYRIERRLGTGGMGVVYLAWHELMERWVAIKMLKSSFIEDSQSVKRFQQEAKAASRLKHPNVITLHDFGVAPNGQPFMVMDYLVSTHSDPKHKARSLAQEIKDLGQLSVEKCIHIIAQACEALEHAHRQGVIHRDVKPANIMIVPNEEDPYFVKVVDFGVAKLLPINSNENGDVQSLTQVGEVCGSPVYMSPEQCLGQSLDPRADIYSMGVVLFETLTGKLPLVGKNMVETMQKHMNEPPPTFNTVRPDLFIPDRVEQVVKRAMAKHPHARPQTMSELAQDLEFSIPRPGQTPGLKVHEVMALPEEKQQKTAWIAPVAIAAIVISIVAGIFFTMRPSANTPPTATHPNGGKVAPTNPAATTPGSATATGTTVNPASGTNTSANPNQGGQPGQTGATTGDGSQTGATTAGGTVKNPAATTATAAQTSTAKPKPAPVVQPKIIGDVPESMKHPKSVKLKNNLFEELARQKSTYRD